MRRFTFFLVAVATMAGLVAIIAATGHADEQSAPYVTDIPHGYRDWQWISSAHEAGNLNSLGAVLGNNVAIKAFRAGKLPFPDGTIIAALHYATFRPRRTTKSLARLNLSFPAPPRTFNLWSRTQPSTPRQAAGGSVTSRMANLATRRL
jgi:Cytochrome P460